MYQLWRAVTDDPDDERSSPAEFAFGKPRPTLTFAAGLAETATSGDVPWTPPGDEDQYLGARAVRVPGTPVLFARGARSAFRHGPQRWDYLVTRLTDEPQ